MPPARRLPDPALRAKSTRFLSGHGPMEARAWVERLAGIPELDLGLDTYSEGPAIERLEQEMATLLGKEAALFFHKGVVAQQVALLVHSGKTNRRVVALHPKCHLALDESDALDRLAGLLQRRLGSDHAPFTVAELERVAEPLAAVTVEIPLRRAAFTATAWDDLVAISAWAREHDVPFHLDGARIWEVQPWYGRKLTEITALADTVYVSFYKGLGGMGGCVLAGPKPFIAAARAWRHRYGGDLYTIFPFILTAFDGLRRHLPRMADYHRHATAIAAALAELPGVTALPAAPHGNSFQLRFAAPVATLEDAAIAHAKATGEWLFNKFEETALPGAAFAEVMIGEAALGWSPAEVAASVGGLMRGANVMRAAAD